MEQAFSQNGICFDFYCKGKSSKNQNINLKIYSLDSELPISSTLPIIENIGMFTRDVQTYKLLINQEDGSKRACYIHHFLLSPKLEDVDITNETSKKLNETLFKVWANKIENDEFNMLVVALNTDYRRANLFRAIYKYLKQLKLNLSADFVIKVLLRYIDAAKILLYIFETKFDVLLNKNRDQSLEELCEKFLDLLSKINGVSEDKVLRSIYTVLIAMLRTNFFQTDKNGEYKDYLSFKIRSTDISFIPLPRPFAEIFVISPFFEAIHLRGGPVARGGLRWSDRLEDFRTEVLGLMKAQMTKNSVIVPVGSKGGFVLKDVLPSDDKPTIFKKGVAAYKTFLRGMLDITDNIINGQIIAPVNVFCHDDHDPYLVVAADKGTATFSDYANSVSEEYDFWLSDAFASGGSAGYDHKRMAITARGAWISVINHFEEMGINPNVDEFTCVGIGDMSGDVFGNGMLLSRKIKLIAAFNHNHIFIDPNPDVETSFAERKRLFELPSSQWSDYSPQLLSHGGGIYSRGDKKITLSDDAKRALNLNRNDFTPDELITEILKAPVDLLWNGGIGTYIKSKFEENERIGDKANDNLRVIGEQVGAKVVGEGGNLGVTQLGRIEYAQKGGRINTDFIDNSAGVDCSDHEVNIKITISDLLKKGKLKKEDRDALLESLTDEVAYLVLKDNHEQTQIITAEALPRFNRINAHAWLIGHLEESGDLYREIEFLPDDATLKKAISDHKGLTRPEIAVLLAYAKNSALSKVTKTSFFEDPFLERYLFLYFPKAFAGRYEKLIKEHKLKREIISTVMVNLYINTLGITSFHQIEDETGFPPDKILKAFVICYEVFNIEELWHNIERFERSIPTAVKYSMIGRLQLLIERNIAWLLHNFRNLDDIEEAIRYFKKDLAILKDNIDKFITPQIENEMVMDRERHSAYDALTPLLKEINDYRILKSAFDIIYIAKENKFPILKVAKTFFIIGEVLHLRWMMTEARTFIPSQYLQILALRSLVLEMFRLQMQLTTNELKLSKNPCTDLVMLKDKESQFHRFDRYISEVKLLDSQEAFVSKITVALKYMKELI
jgi:glutamate dehydrogenase